MKKTLIALMMMGLSTGAIAGSTEVKDKTIFDYMQDDQYTLFAINTIKGTPPTELRMAPVHNIYIFISSREHITCYATLGKKLKSSKCYKLENK